MVHLTNTCEIYIFNIKSNKFDLKEFYEII